MEDRRILICYNEPVNFYSNYIGKDFISANDNVDLSESEFTKILDTIRTSLLKYYTDVSYLGVNWDIKSAINSITEYDPDIIFNFVESIEGDTNYESFVPGMFDILGVQYTGNNSLCLGNCLDKIRTKQLLSFAGIPTPNYQIFHKNTHINQDDVRLKYPIIVKLVTEDASIGISENSVIYNFDELKKQCSYLFSNFGKDIIAEEYIKGRELNISVLGGELLPISEISFKTLPANLPKIVTYEAKWSPESIYYRNTEGFCPAVLPKVVENKINDIALRAFVALGCRDYARVDVRLGKNNSPYVIEVNPNPDISPDAGFIRSCKVAGISYDELLNKLAGFALNRIKYDSKN